MIRFATLLLIIDRLLKYLAVDYNGFFVIGETFGMGFGFVKNKGIGLSIPLPYIFVIPLSIVVLGYVSVLLYRYRAVPKESRKSIQLFALLLVFMGGVSNIFDRIIYSYVIDYISVYLPGRGFAFNVADAMIVVGVGILLIKREYYKVVRNFFKL